MGEGGKKFKLALRTSAYLIKPCKAMAPVYMPKVKYMVPFQFQMKL